MPARTPGDGHARGGSAKLERAVILDSEQSAALREKLLTQLGNIISADLAAAWAREALSAKNSLTATDAKLVEDAFERRLSEIPSSDAAASSNDESSGPEIAGPQVIATTASIDAGQARASARVCWRSRLRVAIATGSTYAMSPSRHVSSAAASPRIPTTWASPSPAHSAARSAMSSRSRFVAGITGRCIARATSAAGGGRPASTRSKLPADSGRRRTEWDRGDLDEKYHLGRKALPRPPIQGARTSAPLRPRKRNPAYRIFPDEKRLEAMTRGDLTNPPRTVSQTFPVLI